MNKQVMLVSEFVPILFFRIETLNSSGSYTTAKEIENFASQFGARVRRDPDSSRHPGSECNKHLKAILSDDAARRTLGWTKTDVIQIETAASDENAAFIHYLIREHHIYPKDGALDLYSPRAASIIIASMLNNPRFNLTSSDIRFQAIPFFFDIRHRSLEPSKVSQNSLFSKDKKERTVLDEILTDIQKEYELAMRRQTNGNKPSGCMRGLDTAREIVLKYKKKEK